MTYLIVKIRLFSLNALNNIVAAFPLAKCDRANRPSPASLRNGQIQLPLTAAECWTLGRLTYDWQSCDLEEWKVFLEMLDFIELICCSVLGEAVISEMQRCIEMWLSRLVKVFWLTNLTPKLHYMLHYASETRRQGPLRSGWTLRFESKHQVFKRLLAAMRNTKAVCEMLVTRHQETMAFRIGKEPKPLRCMKSNVDSVRAELGGSVAVPEDGS